MSILSRLTSTMRRMARGAHAIAKDRSGVAAIEFAFVVPVLLCMYLITMEASQGIEVNRKVSRTGSSVADLITQQSSIQKSEVIAILKIGEAIIQPYNRSKPQLEITAIKLGTESTPVAKVDWSLRLDKNGNAEKVLPKGTVVTDRQLDRIRVAGAYYIRVSSNLDYDPVITWSPDGASMGLLSAFNDIQMGETFYLRPRISTTIPCSDCP